MLPHPQPTPRPFDAGRQHGVLLNEVFPECVGDNLAGALAAGCTSDVRQVSPGDAFVALDDGENDGHESAVAAVARGAVAVVCERAVPVFNVPVYIVEDSRVALGQLCQALVDHPSRQLRVIGVAGTLGKSTVVALLESIFEVADIDTGVISSFKTFDGMVCSGGVSQVPSQAFLASRLARMEAAGCTHALVEVSCKALAQHKLAGIELDAVCVTQVSPADLDVHHTPDNYRKTSARVLDLLSEKGVVVLNADDPVCCRWTCDISAPLTMYGESDAAQLTAHTIERNACEQIFVLSVGNESAAVRTCLVGEHHIRNCLAAAATALACGVALQHVAQGIERLTKLSARMQRVDCGQQFPVFVDAARTPEALRSTLRAARQLTTGRVICVLGDETSRDQSENKAVQRVARQLADLTIVTEARTTTTSWEDEASTQVAQDRKEAIECAVAIARSEDVVVIAGSQSSPTPAFGVRDMETEWIREILLTHAFAPALKLVA